jgi:hypothetical protein
MGAVKSSYRGLDLLDLRKFSWLVVLFVQDVLWGYDSIGWVACASASVVVWLGLVFVANWFERSTDGLVGSWVLCGAVHLKLAMTFFLVLFGWQGILAPVGMLTTNEQVGLVTDSNYYDFLARELAGAEKGEGWELLTATWASAGVVGYGATLYRFFGESLVVVQKFNVLISVAALLLLVYAFICSGVLRPDSGSTRVAVVICSGLPYVVYYESMLAKEPLAALGLSMSLLSLVLVFRAARISVFGVSLLVLGFALTGVVRPNLVYILALVGFFYISVGRSLRLAFSIMLLPVAAGLLGFAGTVDLNLYREALAEAEVRERLLTFRELMTEDSLGLKGLVVNFFDQVPVGVGVVLWPVRALIWLLLPFPMLWPDIPSFMSFAELRAFDWNVAFRLVESTCRIADTWVLLFLLPFFVQAGVRLMREGGVGSLFPIFVVVFVFSVSWASFVAGSRYRTMIEPVAVLMAAIYFADKRVEWSRGSFGILRDAYFVIMLGCLIGFAMLKISRFDI